MFRDFVLNGQANGAVGGMLAQHGFDVGLLRPYIERTPNGRSVPMVTINTGVTRFDEKTHEYVPVREAVPIANLGDFGLSPLPVHNATSLRKEEWTKFDTAVIKAARARLRAWSDLAAANTFGGFDGMSKMILEHETMSDPGEALVDMDGISEGRNDAPVFQLQGLPLPITHAEWNLTKRKLAVSRNTGTPLDATMAEACGRRIAETVEKTLIGIDTGVLYGGNSSQVGGYGRASQVFGYLNFPARLTKTNLTVPTGSNPEATVADVLSMVEQLQSKNQYGPYMIYHSTDWTQFMDNDYARLGGNNATMTLRDRIRKIDGIQDVRRLDYLTAAKSNPFTLLMVQMTPETARAVDGLPLTTFQWEAKGGWELRFKAACIWVPQLRADYYDQCGILHARTP